MSLHYFVSKKCNFLGPEFLFPKNASFQRCLHSFLSRKFYFLQVPAFLCFQKMVVYRGPCTHFFSTKCVSRGPCIPLLQKKKKLVSRIHCIPLFLENGSFQMYLHSVFLENGCSYRSLNSFVCGRRYFLENASFCGSLHSFITGKHQFLQFT